MKKVQLSDLTIKILVVDDDDMICQSVSRILGTKYQIQTAETIADAKSISDHWSPHIALVDLSLKNESGLRLLERLKTQHSDCIRVIMTGHREMDALDAAIRSRLIYTCLYKPLHVDALRSVVLSAAMEYVLEINHQRLVAQIRRQNQALKKMNAQLKRYLEKPLK